MGDSRLQATTRTQFANENGSASLSGTYGNNRTLARAHDLDYRAASLHDPGPDGLDLGFAYDAAGNLTGLHDAALSPPLATLDYDALDRLTAFRDGPTSTPIESYTYDATGNRTSFANAGGTQAYVLAPTSHRLTSVAGVARSYDAAGNTAAIGGAVREFVYDATNRLSEVKAGGVTTRQYAYNGKGERVRSYLGAANLYSVYDESGRWLGDYDGAGAPIQQAIWLDELPVGLLQGAPPALGRLHYVQPDHLGTPRAVIDPVRNVAVWTWDLKSEAFGNSPPNEDPDGDSVAFTFDLRFPGQRYDAASGLNYNYFRDYEPGTGRFAQSDPIGLAGGISTYGYAEQTPLLLIDPLGLAGTAATTVPWYRTAPPVAGPLGRLLLGVVGRAGVLGGLYPTEMGYSSCEAPGVNFNQCIAEKYPNLPFPIVQPMASGQCPDTAESEEEKRRRHCQALKDSILNTCAGLRGRKMFACFAAADRAYRQCMGYE